MRIGIVIWQYLPLVGGSERNAELLGRTLAARGHDVVLVTGRRRKEWPKVEVSSGMRVVRLPAYSGPGFSLLAPGRYITTAVRVFCWVWKRRREFDVLHGFLINPTTILAALAAKHAGIPMTVAVGNMDFFSDMKRTRERTLGGFFARLALKLPWVVAASTTVMREELLSQGFAEEQVTVRPTGIELPPADAVVRFEERRKEVLVVSRITEVKGYDVALAAWRRLAERFPEWKLRVFGDGPLLEVFREQVRNDGLESSVFFDGQKDEPWKEGRYASIYLQPSRIEGLSTSLLESHSYGLPAVATEVGGTKGLEVGGGVTIIQPDDVDGMVAALAELIEDDEKRRQMGDRARRHAEEVYDVERMADDASTLPPPVRATPFVS